MATSLVTERKREVARGLVFDERERLLLIRWRDPVTAREFWEPPGGARASNETFEAALCREVAEETGVADIDVGECVIEFERAFVWAGREFDGFERYFLCRLLSDAHVPPRLDEVERQGFVEARWWDIQTLRASSEELEPPGLMHLLEEARGSESD